MKKMDIDNFLAWKRATQDVLWDDPTTVRIIFDTEDLLQSDHLPGHVYVSASEITDEQVKKIAPDHVQTLGVPDARLPDQNPLV